MTLWWVSGQVVDDQDEGARIPEGSIPVTTYENRAQYGDQRFAWDPQQRYFSGGILASSPGYISEMLGRLDRQRRGEALPWYEADEVRQWEETARAMPTRDIGTLQSGWQGELQGTFTPHGWQAAGAWNPQDEDWWSHLDPGSPDVGPIMLTLRDKLQAGTATPHERELYGKTLAMAQDWNSRASVPQESDANPFGLGDNLMGALMMLSLGAGGAAAAAPLAAGAGLTLSSAGGLLASAGGITSMLAEPLDAQALKLAGLAMGAAGGVTSLASLMSNGLNSVGDVVKAVQKVYGTGTKAMNLINAAKAGAADPGALAQAQAAADTRTQGRAVGSTTQASSAQGDGMDFAQLGPILAGVVGMVGQGLSLSDASRYMEQLKSNFGDQQEIKDMIDQAYKLAVTRYETTYARSEEEYKQKQEQYNQQKDRYETHYHQTQIEQYQRQQAANKGEAQLDKDRATQYENYENTRRRYDESYNQRVQEAAADRERKINVFGEDRQTATADYNRRVQEAQQDRQKEYATFDQQFTRHMSTQDKRDFEAAQERGLDLHAYLQRQSIGADLRDPGKLAAGAQAVYNPLSAAARDRISVQAEEEMARRGVAGGGQYSNLMAAKAFAPQEAQLWQNAMQNYMAGQQGAIQAYAQQDLTGTPQYQWAQTPNFTNSPEYKYTSVPNFGGTPRYEGVNTPTFSRSSFRDVPGTVGRAESPTVPEYRAPGEAPRVPGRDTLPTPYQAYDGGKNNTMTKLMGELTKALGGGGAVQAALPAIMKMLGLVSGDGNSAVQQELNDLMRNNELYGFEPATSYDPFGYDPGQYTDYTNYDPWANVDYSPELPGADF